MIDRDLASFLHGGVAIHLGTRDEQLDPDGSRVPAVAVDDDGTHLVAYVPRVAAARILENLKANGQAALCFVRPTDDRSCQVKGVFEGARPARAKERDLVAAQWQRCLSSLEQIGLPPVALAAWTIWPCVAIRVRVTALFSQTPGPGAGAPMP